MKSLYWYWYGSAAGYRYQYQGIGGTITESLHVIVHDCSEFIFGASHAQPRSGPQLQVHHWQLEYNAITMLSKIILRLLSGQVECDIVSVVYKIIPRVLLAKVMITWSSRCKTKWCVEQVVVIIIL